MYELRYSRENPSPAFRALILQYERMHRQGDVLNGISAEETFQGISIQPHVEPVGVLLRRSAAKSLLDYGCGKAEGYSKITLKTPDGRSIRGLKAIWGLDDIRLYDPGYAPYSSLPTGMYDAVISTDVMEHCPEEDLPWIIGEIFGYATRFIYVSIACYPARKSLPDGRNAHITQRSPGWWVDLFSHIGRGYPSVRWHLAIFETPQRLIRAEG